MAKVMRMEGREGNVYACSWAAHRDGYRLWLECAPIEAWAMNFDRACDDLCERISEILQDGEAVLEISPPPPFEGAAKSWLKPAYVAFEYNETVSCSPEFAAKAEPFRCARCKLLKRDLVPEPVAIASEPRNHFAGVSLFHSNTRIFSAELVALLKSEGVIFPSLREARSEDGMNRRYFEPDLRTTASIQTVSFIGASYIFIGNQCCPNCGYYQLMPTHPALGTERFFVARLDIGPEKGRSFFVRRDNFRTPTLAIPRETWNRIRKNPVTKGVVPASVAFVPKHIMVRHPQLPPLEAVV